LSRSSGGDAKAKWWGCRGQGKPRSSGGGAGTPRLSGGDRGQRQGEGLRSQGQKKGGEIVSSPTPPTSNY
jgi:hypothetical protein